MFRVPAHLKSYRDLVDGSANLTFETPELSDEDLLIIRKFRNLAGWLLFSENEIQEKDIPKEQAEKDTKTPSRRLRDVLFIYWKQLGEPETFDIWYSKVMEKYINAVKEKLDG